MEGTVSQRNGDKARFGRERKRKVLRRESIRGIRKALEKKVPRATIAGLEDKPTPGSGPSGEPAM